MAKAILRSGWLAEFQLSEQLRMEEDLEKAQVGWTRKPPLKEEKGAPGAPYLFKGGNMAAGLL